MSLVVFAAVIFAALLHATWNALVKGSADKHGGMLAVSVGRIPIALLVLLFVPMPDAASLPWLIGSAFLHLGYEIYLIKAYRTGDLTVVYPIARGSAPILVMLVSVTVLGVSFSQMQFASVLLIALGLLSLTLVRQADGGHNMHAVAMALVTGIFIASYSLADGIGAGKAGSALSYWSVVALGNAALLYLWTALTRPEVVKRLSSNRRHMLQSLLGGAVSYAAYALVVWAFTQAPIALVTALRETSIVFALLIGVGILGERLNLLKVVSTMLTIAGAVLLRFPRD